MKIKGISSDNIEDMIMFLKSKAGYVEDQYPIVQVYNEAVSDEEEDDDDEGCGMNGQMNENTEENVRKRKLSCLTDLPAIVPHTMTLTPERKVRLVHLLKHTQMKQKFFWNILSYFTDVPVYAEGEEEV